MNRPSSLVEWEQYIQNLAGQDLFSQAVAANTHTFARTLVEEGAGMADVEQIMLLFVRQLRATGTKIPEGGPFNLVTMALVDPVASRGIQYSPQEVAILEAHRPAPEADDMDRFDDAAVA